jgi:hypothetical protein
MKPNMLWTDILQKDAWNAVSAFKQLREEWFKRHLYSRVSEFSGYDDEEATTQKYNEDIKKEFDEDTEAILRGEKRSIAPTCWNDLRRGRK